MTTIRNKSSSRSISKILLPVRMNVGFVVPLASTLNGRPVGAAQIMSNLLALPKVRATVYRRRDNSAAIPNCAAH